MLRYVSPVQLTGRFMTEDVQLGGVTLERGDLAMVLLASGNRDPDAFADPDRFDVGRDPNNHLGFGFGLHHCLGAPLARMETGVALAALVRRVRTLELASDRLIYRDTVVLRGLEALPVTLTA
jgi:cytochrome P450